MFVVLLKFSLNKAQAPDYMDGHMHWINRGVADGVFLLVGSLQPGLGGGILAHNTQLQQLQVRVNEDPFVAQDVVRAEIYEITPNQTDERMHFLLAGSEK